VISIQFLLTSPVPSEQWSQPGSTCLRVLRKFSAGSKERLSQQPTWRISPRIKTGKWGLTCYHML
jgi:hypothetical protein